MSTSEKPQGTGRKAGFGVFRLKKRVEFTETAKGARAHRPNLSLQMRDREDGSEAIGAGFTVTKKEGNAVERNRIRRRLKAAASAVLPGLGRKGADHVIIGRRAALESPFPTLIEDLKEALAEAAKRRSRGAKRAPAPIPATDDSGRE
jgi:ribonuclease P protein component